MEIASWQFWLLCLFALPSGIAFVRSLWNGIRPATNVRRRYNQDGKSWAVVTGASKGIGAALARELAARGMNVIVMARSKLALDDLCAEIGARNPAVRALPYVLDASQDWHTALQAPLEAFLAPFDVSIVVNNVGVAPSLLNELTAQDSRSIAELIQVNCTFTTLFTRMMVPKLRLQKRACVLNIGSLSAVDDMPFFAAYSASKAYLKSFSSALAAELSDEPIDVQIFQVGPIATGMTGVQKANLLFKDPRLLAKKILNSAGQGAVRSPFVIHLIYSCLRKNPLFDLRLFLVRKLRSAQLKLQQLQ